MSVSYRIDARLCQIKSLSVIPEGGFLRYIIVTLAKILPGSVVKVNYLMDR